MTVMAYKRQEEETIIQATEWTEIANVSFGQDRDMQEEFMLFGYCEYTINNKNAIVSVQVLLDGEEVASDSFNPVVAGQFRSFSPMGLKPMGLGIHYLILQAKGSSLDDVTVRRKRLLIIKH